MSETEFEQRAGSTDEDQHDIDPHLLQVALEKFRSEQNFVGGLIAGLVSGLAGAAVWAGITVLTGYQIGWMAVGVGLLVGYAVRIVGKGIDQSFAIAGAVLALIGCLLGNLFTACHFLASFENMGFFEVLGVLNPTIAVELMKATFSPIDLLFYGIAVYEGYQLSVRPITEQEVIDAAGASTTPR